MQWTKMLAAFKTFSIYGPCRDRLKIETRYGSTIDKDCEGSHTEPRPVQNQYLSPLHDAK